MVVNRVGDLGLTLGILATFYTFGAVDLATIFALAPSAKFETTTFLNMEINNMTLIGTLFLIGAIGKSAQLGLHIWLPQAMEGKREHQTNMGILHASGIGQSFLFTVPLDLFRGYSTDSSTPIGKGGISPLSHNSMANNSEDSWKEYSKLSHVKKGALDGLIISDGHLRKSSNKAKNYRMDFTFKASVLTFINWLKFTVLADYCTNHPITPQPKENPTQYWFCTKSLPFFTTLYPKWYSVNPNSGKPVKVVPEYLKDTLSGVTLAFWIMGDGYWDNDAQTVLLCTESFTEAEINFLIKILKERLDLVATKKKRGDNYRIRLSSTKSNLDRLRSLTLEYMHPSMVYRLGV